MDVDRATCERATLRLAAFQADLPTWDKPAHLAYAAIALTASRQPSARAFLSRAEELAAAASGSARLQRASHYLLAESHRPAHERSRAVQELRAELRARLTTPGALTNVPTFALAIALEATGRLGEPIASVRDEILARRLPNGSYEERPWVTALALQGLVFARCVGADIQRTRDWLERQGSHGEFADPVGDIPAAVSNAYCTLALLHADSGEDFPVVAEALAAIQSALDAQTAPLPLALGLLTLRLVDRYNYARVETFERGNVVVEQRHEHKTTQLVTNYYGDVTMGAKTVVSDSVINRSEIGAEAGQAATVGHDALMPMPARVGPKFCGECGAKLAGGKFCADCGAPVTR